MHDSTQHDDYATGVHTYPAEIRSFLETSARYSGLARAPQEFRRDAAAARKVPGECQDISNNRDVEERGAA